jgi:hypothetical protein
MTSTDVKFLIVLVGLAVLYVFVRWWGRRTGRL